MIQWGRLQTEMIPYPVGIIETALLPMVYRRLYETWPAASLFAPMAAGAEGPEKWSLSERNHPDQYHAFIQGTPAWKTAWLGFKQAPFIKDTFTALLTAGWPLEIDRSPTVKYKTRFEFAHMPAKGGLLKPHRDLASKVVTIILGFPEPGWDDTWGGSTDILVPTVEGLSDYQCDRSQFSLVRAIPHRANQAVVFLKSDTSWHTVGPMTGPAGPMRRTITINIEKFTVTR